MHHCVQENTKVYSKQAVVRRAQKILPVIESESKINELMIIYESPSDTTLKSFLFVIIIHLLSDFSHASTDIRVPQRINPTDAGKLLTFPLAPP